MTKQEIISKDTYDMNDFIEIVRALRAPDGCPWDRTQTHESMKSCLIEECYEVIEAINNNDFLNLREELGDVLLQVVMHSIIAEEEGEFVLNDVICEVARKLVRRHSHVFGEKEEDKSLSAKQGHDRWDAVKKVEKAEKGDRRPPLMSVPKAFPAAIRAAKVLKKAEKEYGYKTDKEILIADLKETLELIETEQEIDVNLEKILLKSVDLARVLGKNAESTLTNATEKFITKFESQQS